MNVFDLASDLIDARRFRLGSRQFLLLKLALVNETGQTTFPALLGGDDARFSQQPLPLPRRANGASLGLIRSVRLPLARLRTTLGPLTGDAEYFVARAGKRIGIGRSDLGHLAKREVFGKAARRQIVRRTPEQGEECAAGRMRAPCAPFEIRGHARALEGVLEQTRVVLGRPQRDGHPIEGHSAACLAKDSSGNFHTLTPFPWRRKQLDFLERIRRRRRRRRKEVPAHAVERTVLGAFGDLDEFDPSDARECVARQVVAFRRRRTRGWRACDQRLHERALRRVRNRHVDEQQATVRIRVRVSGDGARRRRQKSRSVNSRRGAELLVEPLEQRREIAAAVADPADGGDRHLRQRHLFERARQRARKAGGARHRGKVRQRSALRGIEESARGHGLHAERRRWRKALAREQRRGQTRRQLSKTEPVQPEGGPAGARERAREVVSRRARCGDYEPFRVGRSGEDKPASRVQADSGR